MVLWFYAMDDISRNALKYSKKCDTVSMYSFSRTGKSNRLSLEGEGRETGVEGNMVANLFPLEIRPQDVDGAAPMSACIPSLSQTWSLLFPEGITPRRGRIKASRLARAMHRRPGLPRIGRP